MEFNPASEKKLLTPTIVAKRLGYNVNTIYDWLQMGKVFNENDYIRINNRYRVKESAVNRIIEKGGGPS